MNFTGKVPPEIPRESDESCNIFCKDESFLNEEIDSFSIFYWFDFQFWIEIFEVSKYIFYK